jgi:hypothetical protein
MRSEELLEIIQTRPFKPYRFTFTTGETYDLTHPEMMIVGRSLVTLGRPNPTDTRIADGVFHVSLLHLLKVEPILPQPKSENGQQSSQ